MKYIKYIIFLFVYLYGLSLSAQCPDRDFLWNKIVFLRDSSNISDSAQLHELLDHAKRLKICNYQNDSASSFLFQRIGAMYFYLNDFENAVKYTLQAINIIKTNAGKPYVNETRLVKCYSNLESYYDSLKQIRNKNEALDSCISISIRTKTVDLLTLRFIWERSDYLNHTGDYQRCIRYTEMGMSIAKLYRLDTSYIVGAIFNNYANALIFSEQYSKAKDLLNLKIQECITQKQSIYLGGMYQLLALTCKEEGRYDEAIGYFLKSYKYQQQIKYDVGCAESLNTLGFLYFQKLHLYQKALKYYHQAIKYANGAEALNIYNNIANVYSFNNQFDSAHYYFQKSFDQIRSGMNEKTLLNELKKYIDASLTEYVINLILDKADSYLRQYYLEKNVHEINEALRIYEIADLLLGKMKTEQIQSRLFWRTHTRRLYDHAIEASYVANNQLKAFYFFEKSRAVLLQDELNQLKTTSDTDILKQAQIKREISKLEQQRAAMNPSSQMNTGLQNELFAKTQESAQLDQIIREKNPIYYQSFLDTSFISMNDVKINLLNNHQALLELFEGDSAVYSLLMTNENTYFNKIDKNDFDSTTRSYNSYISNLALLNSKFGEYTKTGHHLFKLIFRENILPAGRIIISPSGHYFPFESLVTSTSPAPVYFLNDHAVSYTYSARFLMNDFATNNSTPSEAFLGVAPVHFTTAVSLAALQGSDVSLKEIESYFGDSKILLAEHATKNNFLQRYSRYKIIQLYAHATDSSDSGEPVIHFVDSALYLSDLIAENKPSTRLIVLSACETGKGKLFQGEGVFSFNRGFASIGIPASITNLWAIDNKATYKLTELFYKYLSAGMPVDIALQKSKLEFIAASRENRLPYYWAATIVAGKTDIISFNKTYSWKILVLIIAAISCFIFLFLWIRKKKERG